MQSVRRHGSARWIVAVAGSLLFIVALAGPALAFSCPILIAEANEEIAVAEQLAAELSGETKALALRYIASAKALNAEANDLHTQAGAQGLRNLHYDAELKAHLALSYAEMAHRVAELEGGASASHHHH